jgi:predicted nuclease of predicted toxin-antitoxin system
MKILVDENIPRVTVESLRASGHNVRDIRETSEQGLSDPELWSVAQAEARLLITTDKGFAEHRTVPHHGIFIARLRQPNRRKTDRAVMQWHGLQAVKKDTRPEGRATFGQIET